eukprot:2221450-Prymnesium_polylepis.1
MYVQASLDQFCRWLGRTAADEGAPAAATADEGGGSPFAPFAREAFVGYADYQDMPALFRDAPAALAAVDWTTVLGGDARDGTQSVLWLGSKGASTPMHYDTYGCNLVA